MQDRRVILSLLVSLCVGTFAMGLAAPAAAEASNLREAVLWQALRDRTAFAIMRHALAPGGGDPPGHRVGDCATQRNLSAEGRAQARAIGDRFRAAGIAEARVVSSQWCRCRDTATELRLGPVEDLPALNSFFGKSSRGPAQTNELRNWLATAPMHKPLVLVTHQVNISALTRETTSSGEIVVVRRKPDGAMQVLGSL
jgi:phosphohistidine phosphatase SixA